MDEVLNASLDLARRLPPQNIGDTLKRLTELAPAELTDELLSAIDQPLETRTDKKSAREYLVCDYNRDGDSYRSPWSNEYDPPLDDGTVPSDGTRALEVALNDAFDVYRDMYYEGGVSSAYLWDLEDGFAGVILIKKSSDSATGKVATWDAIHVFEVSERSGARAQAHYKLTSTVQLHIAEHEKSDAGGASGDVVLSGSMTRQKEADGPIDTTSGGRGAAGEAASRRASHVANIGRLVEELEARMRGSLEDVYLGKLRDVVARLRSKTGLDDQRQQRALQGELVGLLRGKSAATAA